VEAAQGTLHRRRRRVGRPVDLVLEVRVEVPQLGLVQVESDEAEHHHHRQSREEHPGLLPVLRAGRWPLALEEVLDPAVEERQFRGEGAEGF
jgi:hypothetical protein